MRCCLNLRRMLSSRLLNGESVNGVKTTCSDDVSLQTSSGQCPASLDDMSVDSRERSWFNAVENNNVTDVQNLINESFCVNVLDKVDD